MEYVVLAENLVSFSLDDLIDLSLETRPPSVDAQASRLAENSADDAQPAFQKIGTK